MTGIETRSLGVLITGAEERKNQDLDLRVDTKQTGQFADGVGFSGRSQIYLAEASTLHQPRDEKLKEDEVPLKKQDFGRRMKAAALNCIELGVRVEMEMEKRESEAIPASCRKRVELDEAIRGIQTTTPTPETSASKRDASKAEG
ncbi:hypothetical protein BGZ98_001286 [Dissophora globulifera]|nr:hypothetical protein BGZ98_001286 [Dissophora globulifera]